MGFSSGLIITKSDAGCGSSRTVAVGTQTSNFTIYCDRDHPGPSSITANGYMYVPKDGQYSFWAHEGQNKYGDVQSVKITLDGKSWYSATNGEPSGSFTKTLKKGLYKINYQGKVYKRTSLGFKQTKGDAIFCNNGK